MTLFWIAAFIVLTAAEALTVSLTCIWFAGGALAGLLVQVLGGSVKLQLALYHFKACFHYELSFR